MIGKLSYYTAKETLGLCPSRVWKGNPVPDFDGSVVVSGVSMSRGHLRANEAHRVYMDVDSFTPLIP